MVEAAPDEKGEYTLLGSEGIDNDGDGRVNEDAVGGYDMNRNWAWDWQPNYIQHGAMEYPFSLPETRALVGIHHRASEHRRRPILPQRGRHDPAQPRARRRRRAARATIASCKSSPRAARRCCRSTVPWSSGRISTRSGAARSTGSMPPGAPSPTPPSSGPRAIWTRARTALPSEDEAAFLKYVLLNDGVVKWHEFDHPQFGKIELGGTKKNWGRTAAFLSARRGMPPQHGLHAVSRRPNAAAQDQRSENR